MRAAALALALGAVALAGCASPAGVITGGIEVLVTDEPGGPPLEGVRLVAEGEGVFVGPRDEATTGPDGRAALRVPKGSVVVATLPGFVTERVELTDARVTLPLFRERLALEVKGTLQGADLQRPGGGRAWSPQEVAVAATPEGREGYAERLLLLNATLAWTNGVAGGGDLALGVSGRSGSVDFWQDADAVQATPGAHEERLRLAAGDFRSAGWTGGERLFAGPGTSKAYAGPAGIPYVIKLEAVFGPPRESAGPTLAPLLALAAAALLAGSLPRRR